MLPRNNKQLLVFGYVRREYEAMDLIPDDIILLFMNWFSNAFYIKISGDSMREFKETEPRQQMKDKYIIPIHDDIFLECTIVPHNPHYHKVELYFQPKSKRKDITKFKMYLETRIEEVFTSMYKELKSSNSNKSGDGFTRITNRIALRSRVKNLNEISISIYTELLKLTTTNTDNADDQNTKDHITHYFVSPIWNKIIEYEWIIDGDKLEEYKSYQMDEWLFSPMFADNSISLHITPDGNDEYDRTSNLGIQFYRLPKGVEAVHADIKLETNIEISDGHSYKYEKTMNYLYGSWTSASGLDVSTINAQIEKSQKLIFKWTVCIKKVYTDEECKVSVDESKWKDYEIFDVP